MTDELPLGGNVSGSVKLGNTVRRRSGAWTPAVHALLAHLRDVGFDAAPVPLGLDEQGRAVLRFIPGDVHPGWPDPAPRWVHEDDATLTAAARLLRRYHDAAADFVPPANARWLIVAPGKHEVICHNDWAPYNAVFHEHEPIAMIDWDSAGPGSRVWDVALSAYSWVPLRPVGDGVSHNVVLPTSQAATRLATFCRGYNGFTPAEVMDMLVDQLPFLAAFLQQRAESGDAAFKKFLEWNVPARLRREAVLLRQRRAALI